MILLNLQENYPLHRRSVKDYLPLAPEPASEDDCPIRIILAEFSARVNAGESPTQQGGFCSTHLINCSSDGERNQHAARECLQGAL